MRDVLKGSCICLMMRSLPHLPLHSFPRLWLKGRPLRGSQKAEGMAVRAGGAEAVCFKHVCERDCVRENRKNGSVLGEGMQRKSRKYEGENDSDSLQSQKSFHTLALVYLIKYLLFW